MITIPWELNASGDCAVLKTKNVLKKTPAKLKSEAVERMTGVSLVSAEFEGSPRVFELKMWMLLDGGAFVEFIGVYMSAFSSGEEDELPLLCVRKGEWSKGNHVDLFSTDFGSGGVGAINTHFFKKDSAESLISRLQELEGYISSGLEMAESQKEENKIWESIRLFFNADMLSLEIEYSPLVKKEAYIETALMGLKDHLDRIDTNGAVPDKSSHRISYKAGVLEQFPKAIK